MVHKNDGPLTLMPFKQNIDLVIIWRMLISDLSATLRALREYRISCIHRQSLICDRISRNKKRAANALRASGEC